MTGAGTARVTAFVVAVVVALTLPALVPAGALACWTSVEAHVVDPLGTGVVPLLNVSVANHAANDSSPVTTVQFSDDGTEWYELPYTGRPCRWVLAGAEGPNAVAVRFGAADGSVSEVVHASIRVDSAGPVTVARSATPSRAGRTTFRYVVRDAGSPRVAAQLVVRGAGVVKRFALGAVRTGAHAAVLKLRLPPGSYTWRVAATDLAGRAQRRQTPGSFVLR